MRPSGVYSELEYFILSLVGDGRSSGYAIRKSMGFMKGGRWSAESGSVYRVLRRLERDGMLMVSGQAGSPNRARTEYAISDLGNAALHDWLVEEPPTSDFAYLVDPIRTRAYFLSRLPLAERLATVKLWLEASKRFLADCESTRTAIQQQAGPERLLAYENLVALAHARHDWLRHVLTVLKQESRRAEEQLLADR